MSAIRPNANGSHDLGTSTHKWGTVHAQNVNAQNASISQDLTIEGNLTVNGNQIINNVETVEAVDPLIKLAKDNNGDLLDIGLYGQYQEGESTKYAAIYRDASENKFKLSTGIVAQPTTTVSGGVVGTLVANVEGNADSASALETPRQIALSGAVSGSVNFDGSANVELVTSIANGTIANDKLAHSSILFGEEQIALGGTINFEGTANQVSVAQAGNTFTFSLPNHLFLGTITASHINAQIEGVSAEANKLATPRQISLGGAVSGAINFDGSSDVEINTSIANGSLANAKLTNSSIAVNGSSISLGGSLDIQGSASQVVVSTDGSTLTLSLPASINVNSASSTILETPRQIALSGAVNGSVNFDGSSNVELVTSIANGSLANEKLTSSSISVNGSSISLGGSLDIQGTASQVAVSTDGSTVSLALPASINVNAQTATALETAREISLSGAVSGAVNFDGSANVGIITSIANGTIANDKLVNSAISFDGTSIALGGTVSIQGSANQVSVGQVGGAYTISLPASINVNSESATALETARQIALSGAVSGSVNFDGSSNVEISTSIANGSIANDKLASNSISFDGANIALGGSVSIQGTADQVSIAQVGGAYTIGLPESILVNAQTASSLLSPRQIALSGAVSGSVNFDGSANVEISTSIANGSVANAKLTNSSIAVNGTSISLGGSLDIQGTVSEVSVSTDGSTLTIGLPNEISADLLGNADTATLATQALSLSTARTISLSGDVVGSVNFDGSANVDIVSTIQVASVENSMLANSKLVFNGGDVNLGDSFSISAGSNLASSQVGNALTLSIATAFSDRVGQSELDIAALDTRLDTAEIDIDTLQGAMTTAQGDITTLQGAMTTAQGNITTLQGAMTTAQGDIVALDGRLDTAEIDIDTLQGEMTTAQGDITSLETSVAGILSSKAQAGGIATLDLNGTIPQSQLPSIALNSTYAVADIAERDALVVQQGDMAIVASETKTYVYTQDNSWLEILSPTFSSSFQSLQDEIDAVELGSGLSNSGAYIADNTTSYLTLATSLKDADKKLDSAILAIDGRVTTAEGNITTLQGGLTTAEGNITSLQGDLGTAEGDILALDTRLTTAEGNISGLQGNMVVVQGDITTLQGGLTTAQGDITTLQASLGTVQSDISGLDTRLTSAEGVNTTQGTRITTLQSNQSTMRISSGLESNLTYVPNNWSSLGFPLPGANEAHYVTSASRLAGAIAILDQKVYEAKTALGNGQISNAQLTNSTISVNGTSIALGDSLTLEGTASEVDVSTSGSTVSIGLPQDVTIARNLTVVNNMTCQGGNLVVEDGSLTVYGGITAVGGNLSVNGGVITSSQANFSSLVAKFVDPLLSIGYDNSSATADLGFYVKDSSAKYQGLVSDTSDSGKWKLLKNLTSDPGTNNVVDLTGSSFADIKVGGLEASTITGSSLATVASLKVSGAVKTSGITTNTNASYSISSSTHIMLVNDSSVGILPAITADMAGLKLVVKCLQFSADAWFMVQGAGTDKIDTQSAITVNLTEGCPSVELLCDGSAWWIVSKHASSITYTP